MKSTQPLYLKEMIDGALHQLAEKFYHLNSQGLTSDAQLHPAIRYVLAGEGKRVRGILCLLAAESLGAPIETALPAAVALELVHAYSLVHDDLPLLDNDDYRRGRLTAHKKFDEPTAILAGDALLTDAFLMIARCEEYWPNGLSASTKVQLIAELSHAAGSHGMVQGQVLDLYWTGKSIEKPETIIGIHTLKTGKLMGAGAAMGAICANVAQPVVDQMRQFGETLGLTFQIRDDLLDERGDIGKTPGKDRTAGKITFLTSLDKIEAENLAETLTAKATMLLRASTNRYQTLEEYSLQLLTRSF